MNVWLSSQAVARLTELLAVVAAALDISDQHRDELDYCRSQVGELMPASEALALAGALREATDRPGLSAAARTDCWSWSSYLGRLLVASPTVTANTNQPVAQARPARNAVLVSSVDHGPVQVASRRPQRSPALLRSSDPGHVEAATDAEVGWPRRARRTLQPAAGPLAPRPPARSSRAERSAPTHAQ
jgi:hypothetical protein